MKISKNYLKFLSCIFSFVLIAAMALTFTACVENKGEEIIDEGNAVSLLELGEGEKQFYLNITDKNGGTASFSVKTDETTVGEALMKLGIIDGENGPYGLFIKSVLGITADFDKDKTYWAFYVGGEYATSGVDTTEIVVGTTYGLKVSK